MPRSATALVPFVLGLLACGGSPAAPGDPPATPRRYVDDVFPSVQVTSGLQYGSAVPAGGTTAAPLRLDLYQPVGDTRTDRPAIVWIHGGGFVSGERTDPAMVELCRRFARKGYVTASITYRLRTNAQKQADSAGTYLDAVADAKAAVRWLRAQATVYGIDTSRVAIGGGSAGRRGRPPHSGRRTSRARARAGTPDSRPRWMPWWTSGAPCPTSPSSSAARRRY